MASPITWMLRVEIWEGAEDDFREVMEEMVASTVREQGALVYDWFADGATVHILERYTRIPTRSVFGALSICATR